MYYGRKPSAKVDVMIAISGGAMLPILSSESLRPRISMDPTFPPELERHIFQLAALLNPESTTTLILLAQRVRIWIEPLLYRVIKASPAALRQLLDTRPATFLHENVRHICIIGVSPPLHPRILSACDATVDLKICGTPEHNGGVWIIGPTPLQRLSVHWRTLLSLATATLKFTQLTHLHLWGQTSTLSLGSPFILNPKEIAQLSYLALDDETTSNSFCKHVLLHYKSLEVLVTICESRNELTGRAEHRAELAHDTRFVMLVLPLNLEGADWVTGAWGGKDFWVRADDFVRKRRAGETSDHFTDPTDEYA
ncbi:hypothetical protein DFH09DRAFT_1472361 [Mycena vulgaris]|nr:hypothetical protein DFH09DRAFT_1472361 [Mycena vulgaris]